MAAAAAISILLGDSQGQALQHHLAACAGDLTVHVKSGRTIAQVLQAALALPPAARASASRVWICAGGNDGAKPDLKAAAALVDLFAPGVVVWVSPPPSTRIADLAKAKAVFGAGVMGQDHWAQSGKTAARAAGAALLRAKVEHYRGARWLEVAKVAAPYGAQPDGIHMGPTAAQAVAKALCSGAPARVSQWTWVAVGIAAAVAVLAVGYRLTHPR